MRKISKTLLTLIAIFSLSSCGAGMGTYNTMPAEDAAYAPEATYDTAAQMDESVAYDDPSIVEQIDLGPVDADRKIERFYNYYIETIAYDEDYDKLTNLVDTNKGFINSSNLDIIKNHDSGDRRRILAAEVKIPVDSSDEFRSEVEKIGQISSTNSYTNDLTKSFTDVNLRLDSKKKELDKLNELLEKANNIDDVMSIQARILEVQTEVDEINASLRDLDSRIAYDTYTINLEEVYSYNNIANKNPNFLARLSQAFADSIQIFINFIQEIIIAIVSYWPIIVIAIIAGILIKKRMDKKVKKDKVVFENNKEKEETID